MAHRAVPEDIGLQVGQKAHKDRCPRPATTLQQGGWSTKVGRQRSTGEPARSTAETFAYRGTWGSSGAHLNCGPSGRRTAPGSRSQKGVVGGPTMERGNDTARWVPVGLDRSLLGGLRTRSFHGQDGFIRPPDKCREQSTKELLPTITAWLSTPCPSYALGLAGFLSAKCGGDEQFPRRGFELVYKCRQDRVL